MLDYTPDVWHKVILSAIGGKENINGRVREAVSVNSVTEKVEISVCDTRKVNIDTLKNNGAPEVWVQLNRYCYQRLEPCCAPLYQYNPLIPSLLGIPIDIIGKKRRDKKVEKLAAADTTGVVHIRVPNITDDIAEELIVNLIKS
jgi:phosphotransferase system IIB component